MVDLKSTFFWPLRVIVVLSLAIPALAFSFGTWRTARSIDEQANERIDRALDVLQEHALKSFQTIERAISEVNEVVRGVQDERIRATQQDFFLRLKRIQQALPQIESIWLFDRQGRPLVSSTILPVPRDLNNSDRDYFAAQVGADAGTYLSQVVRARVGSLRFFVVSARRPSEPPGEFNGVVGVTVMPEHFGEFYRKLSRGLDSFAMFRTDGALLARFPEVNLESGIRSVELVARSQAEPEGSQYTSSSAVDGIERRIGYRKVPGFPLYVTASIETAALTREFWTTTAFNFAIGLPAVLTMFLLALYALHRAMRFQEEANRRQAAEQALKQAQRLEAMGQLTGGVAHDFNNLLMVVSGNAQRIRRLSVADDRVARSLAAIDTAVQRGSNLTRQLLSFARRQTHEAKGVDLNQHLGTVRDMLTASLRGDIAVVTHFAPDLWPVQIDVSEFELALLNLAVNARDAMPHGGELTFSAKNVRFEQPSHGLRAGPYVQVSVTDSGTGIPSDVLKRVFEPFFTTKDVGKGTGLGLSQVYGFAQQAGGTAVVDSEPSKGTTVSLFLPKADLSPAKIEEERSTPLSPARSGTLLLVEDNPDVAEVTRLLLEDLGYHVLYAANGNAAIEKVRQSCETIDLVLSDIVMPGELSGLDLARRIVRERGGTLPVILATGYSNQAQTATDEGFVVLRKPYDAASLSVTIHEALARRAT